MGIIKKIIGIDHSSGQKSPIDKSINISNVDSNNVFLLTDPRAKKSYETANRLDVLIHDIKFNVRRGTPWNNDELEYVAEIRKLLKQEIINSKGAYWWTSPHPTVYLARMKGYIRIKGRAFKFKKGDSITFQCRMAREQRNLKAPLLIGKFSLTNKSMLCGEMKPAMKGM
ncbi:hypothetical protein LCGC14_0874540 [marine sediment metagenome]|uniref:Uncharacterized protein n=1 Tax=marine sediment metagenome TaxID=412755 RepID=A0A0F9PPC6_9ZZZZ|nr:MAG: hypothetical protein Lokiarch_42620 [Candidatus Lokiarchaeum sp. GC14_75]